MHKARSENNFRFKCLKPNCQSTFKNQSLLDSHMRIHYNQVEYCQYCPYRYIMDIAYWDHLNRHFQIKNHKCDHCDLTFTTKKGLVEHESKHEGIIYCCLICKTYEVDSKTSIKSHLRYKHSDVLGKNVTLDTVKKYAKLK